MGPLREILIRSLTEIMIRPLWDHTGRTRCDPVDEKYPLNFDGTRCETLSREFYSAKQTAWHDKPEGADGKCGGLQLAPGGWCTWGRGCGIPGIIGCMPACIPHRPPGLAPLRPAIVTLAVNLR